MKRKIVHIDQEKCNGCGLCVNACHEGAIQLVDGKARLVSDIYCDGLGDCLGECPQDAIKIIEREADPYDDAAVQQRLREEGAGKIGYSPAASGGGCPGMRMVQFNDEEPAPSEKEKEPEANQISALRQWPIQLSLVPVNAPYWQQAEILVAADCVAYALGDFQSRLLQGRRMVVACPKLDQRTDDYIEKLSAILATNDIKSITVAYMEVPCCHGMLRIVEQALAGSGKNLSVRKMKIGIRGDILEDESDSDRLSSTNMDDEGVDYTIKNG